MLWKNNKQIKTCVDIFLIGLSSYFLILCFSRFEIPWIAWIALLPFFFLIKHSGFLRTLLASLILGFIFYSGLLWWGLKLDGINPWNFGLGMLGNACYLGVFGLLAYYFQKMIPKWNILTFPAAWVIIEYLRSHLAFLAFPWGILGYSQYAFLPVASISSFTGIYGISFLIVMVNAILSEILCIFISYKRSFPVGLLFKNHKIFLGISAIILILFSLSLLFGLSMISNKGITHNHMKIGLVQGNVYSFKSNDHNKRRAIFDKYCQLSLHAAEFKPDLIIWPSSSVPGYLPFDWTLVNMLSDLAQETEAFLLVGSSGYDKFDSEEKKKNRVANSAFLFSPGGKIVGRYDKMLLVPFDEYLPLRAHVKWPSWIASEMTDSQPGKELTILGINQYRFGTLICWENMFPDHFRKMAAQGVDFMVSMTNEAFTDISAAHYQMLAMNVFRAIENRVSVIRAATTGVSAIIEPNGRISGKVQDDNANVINVEGYLVGRISLSSKRSFYTKYGDRFIHCLSLMLIGFIFIIFFRGARMNIDDNLFYLFISLLVFLGSIFYRYLKTKSAAVRLESLRKR